jgi:16S rRNA (adenine1518-N6/adenine1519-N6)-dimethyltransferase
MKLPAARRELGQHFLVDENIVAVAAKLADLTANDVVLEVGPGLGVLTAHLLERAGLVHAVEIDPDLEPLLRERFGIDERLHLVVADALRYPLRDLEPPPTKFVSNLPYNVATPLIVESLDGLPSVGLWCVMVQREVADRLFAEPGTKSYGAVSVLVRLTAERTGFHPVSRTVFRPPPNVDSALVAFERIQRPADWGRTKAVVEAAFAHRRKTLPNSLALAGLGSRDEAAAALAAIGRQPATRAEALAPPEFVALAEALG